MADALARYRPLVTIQPPATIDGGDMLRIGRDLYFGRSSRVKGEGVQQLERLLAPAGCSVTRWCSGAACT